MLGLDVELGGFGAGVGGVDLELEGEDCGGVVFGDGADVGLVGEVEADAFSYEVLHVHMVFRWGCCPPRCWQFTEGGCWG